MYFNKNEKNAIFYFLNTYPDLYNNIKKKLIDKDFEEFLKLKLSDNDMNTLQFLLINNNNLDLFDDLNNEYTNILLKKDSGNNNIAHMSVINNSKFGVEYSNKIGINFNDYNNIGLNPVILSIINKNKEILSYLIDKDIDFFNKYKDDSPNILEIATMYDLDIFKIILFELERKNKSNFLLKNKINYYSLLNYSLKNINDDITEFLLKKLDNINEYKDSNSNSILHIAVMYNKKSIINFYIENKFNLTPVNKNGDTPLSIVIKDENYDLINYMLKQNKNFFCEISLKTAKFTENKRIWKLLERKNLN